MADTITYAYIGIGADPLVHPADGIYYVDADRMLAFYMCKVGKMALDRFLQRRATMPITLERVYNFHVLGDQIGVCWMADRMYGTRLITEDEHLEFETRFFKAPYGSLEECVAFMDLLQARARREGYLPT